MTDDAPTMSVDGFTRKFWSEADRLALMAEFERWDGTQVSFCEARGLSTKTFRSWRQRYSGGRPNSTHPGPSRQGDHDPLRHPPGLTGPAPPARPPARHPWTTSAPGPSEWARGACGHTPPCGCIPTF